MKGAFLCIGFLFFAVAAKGQNQSVNDHQEKRLTGESENIQKDASLNSVFSDDSYQVVNTFVNPVLPGDHPDLTLFRDSNNFYACGSNFHFVPYLPILHSTDLVHWKEICRVIPSTWSGILSDAPQGGTWSGVITFFYGSYWLYFSNTAGGGQYFCKADNPAGPWSLPVKMKSTSTTGPIGYDNSVFVDEDGRPYMLIKPAQLINRIQEIGPDGHLMGDVMNLDWVNNDGKYSWAEGPVMCKRDGWYYYFVAGNVYGGQYVLRSKTLTADSVSWEEMGNFFENVTDGSTGFRSPNHISQPVQLSDSTWWVITHSYEGVGGNDWNGQGRQGLLHQVTWDENGKPTGKAPTSTPQAMPGLPKSDIPWKTPRSDYFENDTLELSWHFLNRSAASRYSLTDKPGWLTLKPGSGKTHILHKETRHHYAMVTRLEFEPSVNGQEAGLYLTNGNESLTAALYSGYNNKKIIGLRFGTTIFEVDNTIGDTLWLKIERVDHQLKGYYGSNGIRWTQIGTAVNSSSLDKSQENYNWWVGTSNGLFAVKKQARFDMYAFKDGFSDLPAIGYNNYFGLVTKGTGVNKAMTNSTDKGGWLMLAGVDLGRDERIPVAFEAEAASTKSGVLEVWIDDLERNGTKISTVNIDATGSESKWAAFKAPLSGVEGQHDIYLRWVGNAGAFLLKKVKFIAADTFYVNTFDVEIQSDFKVYPNPSSQGFTVENNRKNVEYSIYNIRGVLVESGVLMNSYQKIGQNLKQGIYILKVDNSCIKLGKL